MLNVDSSGVTSLVKTLLVVLGVVAGVEMTLVGVLQAPDVVAVMEVVKVVVAKK